MSDEESILSTDYHKSKFLDISQNVICFLWFIFAIIVLTFSLSTWIFGDKVLDWIDGHYDK